MRGNLTHVAVSKQIAVRYHMARMNACDKLTTVQWHSQTFPIGWYVNSNVDKGKRQAINREISTLRLDNVVQSINGKYAEEIIPATCGKQIEQEITHEEPAHK